jgi:peptidoglycan/LPS O-acetylase OafA/YrhL
LAAERAGKPILPAGEVTLLVGAAIVLAELSYRVVENPVRSSALLRKHPRVSVGLGVVLTLATFGLMEMWLAQA